MPFTSPKKLVQNWSIHRLLKVQAALTPETVAISAPGRKPLPYSRLLSQVDAVVETLHGMGIGRNNRVAMVLPNGPEMAVSFLGVTAGATCAPLNPSYQADEFEFCLSDLKADALIVPSETDSSAITVAQKSHVPIIELTLDPQGTAGIFSLRTQQGVTSARRGLAEATDVALMLHTSGTTSRPKLVALTHTNLLTSATNIVATLMLTERDCCFNMMPLFHIHGLVGALLSSLVAGSSVVCAPGFDPEQFFSWWEEYHPTWYTAVPPIHQAILSCRQTHFPNLQTNSLRLIRSCSAPLPPRVMRKLQEVFQVPVIESYGMTEAAHQITSNPLPPRERKVGSVGLSVGTEVRIVDEQENPMPVGQSGEIVIRGFNVTEGYANNPAANAGCFSSRWFRTGDVGYLDREGYLFITGRLKEIINKGGEKVSPREVDEVIMQHNAVAEVATFAVSHPVLGEDVAAAIVLRKNISVTEKEIREFAFDRLSYFKVPRQVVVVDKLPRGATGKVLRTRLAAQLGLASNSMTEAHSKTGAYAPPRTGVEGILVSIWERVLNLKEVGIEDNFFDLGGHSLLALTLIDQVKKILGKDLRLHSLYQAPTIKELANLMEDGEPSPGYSSLVPLQPNGTRPAFFWIHGEYSNALLSRYLGADQPLYGFMHQSEDGKPAVYTEVETIAKHYLEEMQAIQADGPYFLGGYSFGGTVAFEMAQQLRRQGKRVTLLFLLDSPFPALAHSANILPDSSLTGMIQRQLANIASLPGRQKLDYLVASLGRKIIVRFNNTKAKIGRYQKRLAIKYYLATRHSLPVSIRSFYILGVYRQAILKYAPRPYSGRVFYVKSGMQSKDHLFEWDRLIGGGLEVYEIPGDHLDLKKESHVHIWAKKLKDWLRAAQETSGHHRLHRDRTIVVDR